MSQDSISTPHQSSAEVTGDAISTLATTWDGLARTDPLWAILRADELAGNRWNLDAFMQTGEKEMAAVMDTVSHLEGQLNPGRALDFGCGVGRLTQALAKYFDEVSGVDISATMVALANSYNRFGPRCRYFENRTNNLLLFPDGSFDFIYSNKVLQHMSPELATGYLREFVRVLSPAGLLVFQLPSHLRLSLRLRARLRHLTPLWVLARYRRMGAAAPAPPPYEMHAIRRSGVENLIRESRARVIRASQNREAGPAWVSFTYFVRKTGGRPA